MTWKGKERRQFPRADFPCRIVVGFPSQSLTSRIENIGRGGVRVILEEKLNHFDIVGLVIFPSNDKSIKCEGRVVWVVERVNPTEGQPIMFDTGIEFITISDPDREYIKNLVDKILSSKENLKEKNK